jgi:peroxiredoxin Q/BCP
LLAASPSREYALAMPIEVGQKAPAFTLTNHAGEKITLDKLKGKWAVLYFYPKDDTPGCTVEACEFTAGLRGFQGIGAEVYGVSPDSVESHAAFREKHKLKVPLLADPSRRMLTDYAAWGMKNMYGKQVEGVIRSTVLVDPEGNVAHHWKAVRAEGHAGHVKKKIEELRAAKT